MPARLQEHYEKVVREEAAKVDAAKAEVKRAKQERDDAPVTKGKAAPAKKVASNNGPSGTYLELRPPEAAPKTAR